MLVDWFTVSAQVLNFLILVWLMKRFLYRPILQAIDARESRIATELADADAKAADAKKERSEFQRKNAEFDEGRTALLSQATEEANAEGQRLKGEAREAAEVVRAKRQQTLRDETHDLSEAIGHRTRDEVFRIARKVLTDLATTSLEERMSEVFTRRVRAMDGESKARLATALKTASDPALVRSAFALPTQQRAAIQNALREAFSSEVHVRFEAAPGLIGGIELSTNGQKVAWSIDEYLGSLERSVGELLGKGTSAEPEVEPGSAPVPVAEAHERSA